MRCFTLQEYSSFGLVPSDTELIERFLLGDEEAFEAIMARYLGLISSIAKKYRHGDFYPDTPDLIQEAMVAMLGAVRKYDERAQMSFKNFLALCVENRFKSILRTSNAKTRIPDNSMISIDEETEDVFDSGQSTVAEMVESKEHTLALYRRLKEKLSGLEYRATVLYLRGYSVKESAELLKISEKSVENALSRTRKKISKH